MPGSERPVLPRTKRSMSGELEAAGQHDGSNLRGGIPEQVRAGLIPAIVGPLGKVIDGPRQGSSPLN